MSRMNKLELKDCEIFSGNFRNFSGVGGQYNREGNRNFTVGLSIEQAAYAYEAGWNVKELRPREEGDMPKPYLNVTVNFNGGSTRIYIITSRGKTLITEDTVHLLDTAEITKADIILNPYFWTVGNNSGVKAYLHSAYFTIFETDLDREYAELDVTEEY